jgi:CDGSH-type Zn-finger protein
MDKPKCAAKEPKSLDAIKDKNYAWCTCGLSETQALCNGAHKGTGFAPQIFKEEEDKKVWLCQCKQTKNPPYCDGSHNSL